MLLIGTSSCGAVMVPARGAGAGGPAGAGARAELAPAKAVGAPAGRGSGAPDGRAPAPFAAASTSAFMIRPFGPLPLSADRSMPAWFAMRRARGDANTRSDR